MFDGFNVVTGIIDSDRGDGVHELLLKIYAGARIKTKSSFEARMVKY